MVATAGDPRPALRAAACTISTSSTRDRAGGRDERRPNRGRGETWNTLTSSTGDRGFVLANAVAFTSATRGWAVGHGGSLRRTDDGGASWTPVALPLRAGERPILRGISFCEPDHGWIAGELGTIFRTRDGGTTWTLQESGVPIVRVIPRGEEPRPREWCAELENPRRIASRSPRSASPTRRTAGPWADSDVAELGRAAHVGWWRDLARRTRAAGRNAAQPVRRSTPDTPGPPAIGHARSPR